jgi:hypothetical protein
MRFGEAQLFSYGKSVGCHGEAALETIATKTCILPPHLLGVRAQRIYRVEVYKLNNIIILRVSFDCIKEPSLLARLS